MKRLIVSIFLFGLHGFLGVVHAQTPFEGGAVAIRLEGNTDNYISIPFVRQATVHGTVESISANTVTFQNVDWIPDEFKFEEGVQNATFYLLFVNGALEGVHYDIIGNTVDTLILDTQGDDLTNHPLGNIRVDDQIKIIAHWTLGDLFGSTDEDIVIEPSPSQFFIRDIVFLPQHVEPFRIQRYVYYSGVGWRPFGDLVNDRTHTIVQPQQGIIIRRRVPEPVTLFSNGNVRKHKTVTYVHGSSTGIHYAFLGNSHSDAVSLDDLGLVNSAPELSAVTPSPNPFVVEDVLFSSFDNGQGGKVVRSFYYLNNIGWIEFGAGFTPVGHSVSIEPGVSFVIRKKRGNLGADWVFQP